MLHVRHGASISLVMEPSPFFQSFLPRPCMSSRSHILFPLPKSSAVGILLVCTGGREEKRAAAVISVGREGAVRSYVNACLAYVLLFHAAPESVPTQDKFPIFLKNMISHLSRCFGISLQLLC